MDNTIIVCVCIILLLLFIHANIENLVYRCDNDIPSINFDELRAGDILFMKYCEKCKYTGNIFNDAWISSYRRLFNTFRFYVTKQHYTHVAIVLNIKGIPTITHIDRGAMYDLYTNKRQKGQVLLSPWHHLNIRGGIIHAYKYIGPSLPVDSSDWIESNNNITYPRCSDLILSNGLKWKKHPSNVMACTDYVEHTVYNHLDHNVGITPPSKCATLTDINNLVKYSKNYMSVPLVVKNKCYYENHI